MKVNDKNNNTRRSIPRKLILGGMALIFLISLSTCYYDNEEALYPIVPGGCDTTQVSFSGIIKPMLSSYCYGCHSNVNSSFGNNIKLEDYADVKTSVDNGKLYGSISHDPSYSPMPKGGGKLEMCKITQLKFWIDKGALND